VHKTEKVDNGLKLFLKLSLNVRYYTRTFSVVLPSSSRIASQTFGVILS
jgi:hypothetical protein